MFDLNKFIIFSKLLLVSQKRLGLVIVKWWMRMVIHWSCIMEVRLMYHPIFSGMMGYIYFAVIDDVARSYNRYGRSFPLTEVYPQHTKPVQSCILVTQCSVAKDWRNLARWSMAGLIAHTGEETGKLWCSPWLKIQGSMITIQLALVNGGAGFTFSRRQKRIIIDGFYG